MINDSQLPDKNETPQVRVARIGKPHGIRGEVTVEVFTDSPETRFAEGTDFRVEPVKSTPSFASLTVEKARWNKKILLLKFYEVSDRNTAESFRNAELYAPMVTSPEGQEAWYAADLIGLAVYENDTKTSPIGEVEDLVTAGPQDLLEVRLSDGRRILVPFVEEIVPMINEEEGIVVITPPPGLLELNQD
jgi:16S rRNA processing protein RimM